MEIACFRCFSVSSIKYIRYNALGYSTRTLDGIFGNNTETALKAFQRSVGLTADGICGCNSWKKLTSAVVGIGRTRTVID